MKKILLFASLITALTLNSYSDDDDGGGGGPSGEEFVKARIGGADHTFDVVNVTEEPHDGWTDLRIKATTTETPQNWIEIVVEEGAVGPEASWFFGYYVDEDWHEQLEGWTTTVTENNENVIKGTFSGQVQIYDDSTVPITITNGEFSVNR